MAITFVNQGNSGAPDFANPADQSSYDTTSWTPPNGDLLLLFVGCRVSTSGSPGLVPVPTVSGNGLTWVEIATKSFRTVSGVDRVRITLFAADLTGGASAGVTTIDMGSAPIVRCDASFFKADGVDLSGGVAAAFVQAVTDSTTSSNDFTLTLASPGSSDNRPVAGFYVDLNEAITPRTNWTEMDEMGGSSPTSVLETQVREDAFDTTAEASWTTLDHVGAIAVELKAAGGGGSTAVPVFYHQLQQQGIG